MPPQCLLFFRLLYSQLIWYSNIINHLRQEQLSVFSKSGSEIPFSLPLTPIKAFLSAFIYFCNTGAQAHPFVKLFVYTNHCKTVHTHVICASSSRNCSHWRAWHVKLGRLATDQHNQETKLTLYVFILYPNSKAASPATAIVYLPSAALRRTSSSAAESHQQHRTRLPTAPEPPVNPTVPSRGMHVLPEPLDSPAHLPHLPLHSQYTYTLWALLNYQMNLSWVKLHFFAFKWVSQTGWIWHSGIMMGGSIFKWLILQHSVPYIY